MIYCNLGRTGLRVSAVCLGTWHLSRSKELDEWSIPRIDIDETKKLVKLAVDNGVNFIDTANRYHGAMGPVDLNHVGNAERILGEVLRDYDRESLVIVTKVAYQMAPWANGEGLSRKHIFWQNRESLKRLGVEYVDVYLAHGPDKETPHLETLIAFNDLVRMGKAHYIGSSNFSPEENIDFMELSQTHGLTSFVAIQEAYNMLDRTIEYAQVPIARKYNFSVMAYSPLAEGLLSNKYLSGIPEASRATYSQSLKTTLTKTNLGKIGELSNLAREKGVTLPQFALAWILHKQRALGINIVPIVGASNSQQLLENIQALEIQLSEDDIKRAEEIASNVRM